MFSSLEVSIFDISDLTDPQLLHRYAFDGGWSTSTPILDPYWIPFTGDHHAAGYFPEEQIFTIPVFSTAGGNLDGVESTPFFEPGEGGLQVFQIDVSAGFTPLAFIEHDSPIEHTVRIGDRLFAISSGTVSVHDLADPAVRLGEVSIGAEAVGNLVELTMYQPVIEVLAVATLSQTASDAGDQIADPRLGWALPTSERSGHAQPARVAAFAHHLGAPRVDAELIQLLAREAASREASSDTDAKDRRFADEEAQDDRFRVAQHQELSASTNPCSLELELASA
jgi:hypothetical protein